jgi:dinuclear metal center YbgI/SA1388 family protein
VSAASPGVEMSQEHDKPRSGGLRSPLRGSISFRGLQTPDSLRSSGATLGDRSAVGILSPQSSVLITPKPRRRIFVVMLITEFIRALEEIVPLGSIGYEKDAVGMQVALPRNTELTKVLVAYEVTQAIIDEAKVRGANLILAFHPLIFPSVRSIGDSDRTGALIRQLVKNDIALYIQHTAFDTHPRFGTSRLMAEVLELENIQPLTPLRNSMNKIVVFVPVEASRTIADLMSAAGAGRIGDYTDCSFTHEGTGTFYKQSDSSGAKVLERVNEVRIEMICDKWNTNKAVRAMLEAHPYEEPAYDVIPLSTESPNYGMGAVGEWPTALQKEEVLAKVRDAFGTKALRHSEVAKSGFKRAAMVGGSGMEFYGSARPQTDVFITADVRYHDFYRAEHDNVLLIDAGHAETERFVAHGMGRAAKEAMAKILRRNPSEEPAGAVNLSDETAEELVLIAQAEPNAVRYFV